MAGMKPRIRKVMSGLYYAIWVCESQVPSSCWTRIKRGHGYTPQEAYRDWEAA